MDFKIYAVDFDGILAKNKYPIIGKANKKLIKFCINEQMKGNKIILWTCRSGLYLTEAIDWCFYYGLEFDAVNDNIPEMTELFGSNSRKIYASYYIDDKNIGILRRLRLRMGK